MKPLETDILEAARNLVNRLDFIHADEHYKTVWFSYHNHGGDYTDGPKYDRELSALKKVIRQFDDETL